MTEDEALILKEGSSRVLFDSVRKQAYRGEGARSDVENAAGSRVRGNSQEASIEGFTRR